MNQGQAIIHYIFTPKYRKQLLAPVQVAEMAEALMKRAAAGQGAIVRACAVQPDHVHIMIELPRTKTPAVCAQEMKRQTSLVLRKAFPEFRQYPGFWGRRYFMRSVGGGVSVVNKYIEDQMRRLEQ